MIYAPVPKITDQMYAYLVIITGCVMIIVSHHFGITEAVGAGIVGAGIQAFTAQTKPSTTVATGNPPTVTTTVP